MSKTVATCIAETNQEQNKPQENVFFLTLSRKIEDFPNEFLRTARSTSPIQVCAIFSTIGPDNLAAELNLELNSELEKIVAQTANQPVLDFEAFSNQVVNVLNVRVCNFGINKGKQFKTSMTMLVIEGDILRVVHLGVTKAVLFRDRKIMVLTEEQSVANRFAQMGSNAGISPDDPASMEPTQYLGKMPQEGELRPEKKVHLKLRDNDEIILMGLGISKGMPVQMRNSIIIKPVSTEEKAKEIINAAVNYGVKSGLTIIDLKVESTFLLPGDAVIRSNLQTEAAIAPADTAVFSEKNNYTPFDLQTADDEEDDADDTINFVPGNAPVNEKDEEPEEDEEEEEKERGSAGLKIATVIMPIIIFVLCLILGFGIMFLVFNIRDFIESNAPETMASAANGSVYYAVNDNTPVYSQPSLNSTVIATLNKGDVVTVQQAADPTFSKVVTSGSLTGYCLTAQLSQQNPAEAVPSESSQTSETNPGESANGEPADTEETTTETEEPEATPTPTPKPVKKATATPTPKPVETEPEDTQPAETAKPTETQKPAETEKPAETQKPAETTKKAEDPKPEDPKPEGNE
jgi:serine/threonine protein phosphatase PrpC